MTNEERADAILATLRKANLPHPHDHGMRVVGWVVPEELAGLSDALFALDVIVKRAMPLQDHAGLNKEIVRLAAEAANKLTIKWMPERWLNIFVDAYDDIAACRAAPAMVAEKRVPAGNDREPEYLRQRWEHPNE